MAKSYLTFLSKKGKYILLINLLLALIFASLYYIQDYIISYYPIFSEKYLLELENNNNNHNHNKHMFTLKPFLYYIWFSLITQTTIGYGGIISKDGNHQDFLNIRSIPFKILNILQIISIFIVPAIIL